MRFLKIIFNSSDEESRGTTWGRFMDFNLSLLTFLFKLQKWTTRQDITTRPYIQKEIFHNDIALAWSYIYIFSKISYVS